nr:alpha-taxilin [Leptinotarsa decemlineata]
MEDKVSSQPSVGPSDSTGAIRKVKRSKRDLRSWDHLIKAIGDLSEDEKLDVIKEKYCDLHNEFKTTASTLKAIEKQLQVLQRDKEHIQADLTKNILSRSKMESLARELQKQNKEIKEENSNRLKEEEDKRKEVAATFTEKLNSLTQLMDENKDKSLRLREENMKLTSKLTELYDQFQERETHLSNMNRQMELQKKLSDTQLKKLDVEFETEREIWQKERTILLSNLEKSEETNKLLQENVNTLQFHIDVYQKQYSEFEITMKKSNKVFDSFKDEMTKMQKANATLEKDRNEWHQRWKAATQSALNLTELHQECSSDLETAQRKIKMLEKLCRKLQVERSAYLCQLKDNNIVPVTPPPHFEEEAGAIHEVSSEKEKLLEEPQPTAQKKDNMGPKKKVLEVSTMQIYTMICTMIICLLLHSSVLKYEIVVESLRLQLGASSATKSPFQALATSPTAHRTLTKPHRFAVTTYCLEQVQRPQNYH